jgi:hypothetical protein
MRHFYQGLLVYIVSISRLWRDQRLNYEPLPTRDDWADLLVLLYTGNDDTVVSADRLVKRICGMIDPTVRVTEASKL